MDILSDRERLYNKSLISLPEYKDPHRPGSDKSTVRGLPEKLLGHPHFKSVATRDFQNVSDPVDIASNRTKEKSGSSSLVY